MINVGSDSPADSHTSGRSQFITLVHWRILRNIRSLKFAFALIIAVLLGLANGYFSAHRLTDRLQEYRAARQIEEMRLTSVRTFCEVMPSVFRIPSEGSILSSGTGEMFGSAALLPGIFGKPLFWSSYTFSNPFLYFRISGGFASACIALLALISFLFTFSSISGSQGSSALRIILAQGVPRYVYLFAEYLACLLTIVIPMIIGLIMLYLAAMIAGVSISLVSTSVLGFLLLGLLAISAATWLGLWVSGAAKTSRSALIILIVIWAIAVWVWPATSAEVARALIPSHEASRNLQPRPTPADSLLLQELPRKPAETATSVRITDPRAVYWYYLPKAVSMGEHTLLAAQHRLAKYLGYLSFFVICEKGIQTVCGTGADSQFDFERFCSAENKRVADWHRGQIRKSPGRCFVWTNADPPLIEVQNSVKLFVPETESVSALLPACSILVFWNCLFALVALFAFNRRSLLELA